MSSESNYKAIIRAVHDNGLSEGVGGTEGMTLFMLKTILTKITDDQNADGYCGDAADPDLAAEVEALQGAIVDLVKRQRGLPTA